MTATLNSPAGRTYPWQQPGNSTLDFDWRFPTPTRGTPAIDLLLLGNVFRDGTPSLILGSIDSLDELPSPIASTSEDTSFLTEANGPGRAVSDLKDWLGLNDQEIADLTGVSRRSVVNWRAGKGSYNKTIRNLLGLHTLVRQLREKIGLEQARMWLMSADDSGASPLQGLAEDPSLITSLIQKASPLLFARTHNVGTIEVDEVEEQRMLAALLPKGDQAPQLRPARRPRRAPRGR